MAVKISELETLEKELVAYVPNCRQRRSQPAKEILFAAFAERVFKIKPEEFSEKMETPVTSKLWLVKGRIDAVFGNVIIEFKLDLEKEIDDAKDELTKYFQSLKERYPKTDYLAVATDGLKFTVFKPVFDPKGTVRKIEQIDHLDLEKEQSHPEKIYLWFDSYLYLSEKTIPTTDDLRKRFGAESPTFAFMKDTLRELLEVAIEDQTVKTKVDNWEKYLEIVYGDKLTSTDLFVGHTYLATLAKVIVYLHLYEGKIPSREDVISILDGKFFEDFGITNFIEEDFFAWILNENVSQKIVDLVLKLLRQLLVYDLTQLSEDVFKELYQELVDPEVRHGLGEYYTPDWLAEYMLKDPLKKKPTISILDPACGSGTFLFTSIRLVVKELRSRRMKPSDILAHVLNNIAGVDIHPLAVMISRTNYLLALKDLLNYRGGKVSIPVYMSDSIKLPEYQSEMQYNVSVYRIEAGSKSIFFIPKTIGDRPSLLDDIIAKMYYYSRKYESGDMKKGTALESFSNSLSSSNDGLKEGERRIFERNMGILVDMIDSRSDSIWTFILRNIYRPIALSERKFDLLIGNPPWIAMNVMKNPKYQSFLKESSSRVGLLDSKSPHLFTHMEIATLFYVMCARLYLNDSGRISFVMPATIVSGDQHALFRNGSFPDTKLAFKKLVDLSNVEPLFNVKACVLESEYGAELEYPIVGVSVEGTLERKNASFEDATRQLSFTDTEFELVSTGKRNFLRQMQLSQKIPFGRSWYFEGFREGATIVPRPFWFVDVIRHPRFGVNPAEPLVRTSQRAKEKGKKQYEDVNFEDQIESRYLYGVVTGSEMIPFALTGVNLTVLPIEPANGRYRIIKQEEAENKGHHHLAKWLRNAETTWVAKRASKAKGTSIYQWIDYRRKLSGQSSKKRYAVIYEAVGTYLVAAVVDRRTTAIKTSEGEVKVNGIIIDYSTIFYETDDRGEADYLCAILNSKIMDQLIKPLQATGLWGPRNIWKKVLDIPIPRFSQTNKSHVRLAELGQECSLKVGKIQTTLLEQHSIGRMRTMIRDSLSEEISDITDLTTRVLLSQANKKKGLAEYTR